MKGDGYKIHLNVRAHDGYSICGQQLYWSPRFLTDDLEKVTCKSCLKIAERRRKKQMGETFDIGKAVKSLKEGKKVRRRGLGWGYGCHLELEGDHEQGMIYVRHPSLGSFTWKPLYKDLLAEDWELVDP